MPRSDAMPSRIVIAIGGNATHPEEIAGTAGEQKEIAARTAAALLPLGLTQHVRPIDRAAPSGPCTGPRATGSELVKATTLLRIRQHVVRLGNLFEPFLSLGVPRIHIRVVLARQLPIRRLDVTFGRRPRDPENLVVILVHLVSRRLPRQACVEHVAHTSPVAQSKSHRTHVRWASQPTHMEIPGRGCVIPVSQRAPATGAAVRRRTCIPVGVPQ